MGDETRALTNTFSLARACGLFLLCAVIASPHSCLRPLPWAGVLFLGYFCLIATTALFHAVWRLPNWFWTASTMLQLAGMFVIAASLFMDQRLVRHALVALALAGGMASALQMLGVGTRSFADGMHPDMERSAFGSMDPNFLAVDFGYCFLAALAVSAGLVVASGLIRILCILALAPLAGALSSTCSRGGLVGLALGVVVLVLASKPGKRYVWLYLLAGVSLSAVLYLVFHSEGFMARLEKTFDGGDTSGRIFVWQTALQVWMEAPVFGYGAVNYMAALGQRLGKAVFDTHNLYLTVVLEGGLMGAVLYYAALGQALRRSARTALRDHWPVPLALMASMLAWNLALTCSFRKTHWLLLALVLRAAGHNWAQQAELRRGNRCT